MITTIYDLQSLFFPKRDFLFNIFRLTSLNDIVLSCIGYYQCRIGITGPVFIKDEFQCYYSPRGKMQFMPGLRSKRALKPRLAMNFQRDLSKFITTMFIGQKAVARSCRGRGAARLNYYPELFYPDVCYL